jgi:dipeptidyl aminopeptidase/acylaminoacyl peptidase
MTRLALLLAAAAIVTPIAAEARPMTATDLQSVRRVGAPEVSLDGRTAIFSVSTTDFDKNRRNNVLHSLDLRRAGAAPQPVAGAEGARDAVFGPDGAIYFLKAVGERDQLHRLVPGQAAQVMSDFGADVSGFKIAPDGRHVVVWADQRDCPDLACAATTFAAPSRTGG